MANVCLEIANTFVMTTTTTTTKNNRQLLRIWSFPSLGSMFVSVCVGVCQFGDPTQHPNITADNNNDKKKIKIWYQKKKHGTHNTG